MALNIRNPEIERLAAEVAELARESKTEAIRNALRERARRLRLHGSDPSREQRVEAVLARFREEFPKGDFGRSLSKEEEEQILGFGPDGV